MRLRKSFYWYVILFTLPYHTMKSWQMVIYKWEYRMVYGIYEDWYVSLCLHDYLDTECDTMVHSKALQVVDNNDYYVVDTWKRIVYIKTNIKELAIDAVKRMWETIESIDHWSVFIS